MSWIRLRKAWDLPENRVTPEPLFQERRRFLKKMGLLGGGLLALWAAPSLLWRGAAWARESALPPEPALTPETLAAGFNNFYEFGADKTAVRHRAQGLNTEGWQIRIGGLVKKPRVLDLDSLLRRMPLEERTYRLRCVETWSAVIPWRGFPLRELIRLVEPLSTARYVRFQTFLNPELATGQWERFWEPWPYTEGLRLDEAMHELSFLAVGMYGHPLNPQNGAPIRLAVPWKYGFKWVKSITAIEFTSEEPETFWQILSPLEYDFAADVRPEIPYARWAQQYEIPLGTEERVPTLPFNGYAEQVASLFSR